MKKNIKATALTLTSEITDYLDKRLDGLQKFLDENDESIKIDVELGRTTTHHEKGDIFRAEINIFSHGKIFRAEAEAGDIFSAIDCIKDEMQNELRSNKRRSLHFIKKSGQRLKNFLKGFTKE